MVDVLRKSVLAAAIACMGLVAHADVLTFEELSGGLNFFKANYQGFTFGTNSEFTNAWFYTSLVNAGYAPHSGRIYVATDYRLYVDALWNDTQPIASSTAFKFDGAWFSGSDQVRYKLFNGGTLVFTSADSPVLTGTPIWVPSDYLGLVDSVVVVGRQGYYAMDDFTLNTPVPEPARMALFALGLFALGCHIGRRAG